MIGGASFGPTDRRCPWNAGNPRKKLAKVVSTAARARNRFDHVVVLELVSTVGGVLWVQLIEGCPWMLANPRRELAKVVSTQPRDAIVSTHVVVLHPVKH